MYFITYINCFVDDDAIVTIDGEISWINPVSNILYTYSLYIFIFIIILYIIVIFAWIALDFNFDILKYYILSILILGFILSIWQLQSLNCNQCNHGPVFNFVEYAVAVFFYSIFIDFPTIHVMSAFQ